MARRKRNSYKFTEKTHSKRAMISFGIAGCTLLMYLIFIYLSYKVGGNLSAYYGSFGFLAMIAAVVALVMSLPTLKEEDSFTLFPKLALIVSALSSICWVGTYVSGFLRG
ncbi:MAG: hypothetical protein IJO60_02890 [Agathobacter sp.]|nr:hypothetical protein [Agathobacter sp.]